MEEWKEYKLGDVCDFQEGYVNPPQGNPEYFDGDVKWLRATDLNDGYVYSTTRTLTQLGFKSARKSAILFKPGTIAISKSGTIGRLGILQDYMCGNRAVINIIPHYTVNTYFVFLVLRSYQRYFPLMAVGSVQKNLYISILEDLKINLPDLNTQNKIVSILSSLDDKIELNRKINANLEAQAQALFKSWFVDFEPFKDQPFVESELGMIPEGWRVGNIYEYIDVIYGAPYKSSLFNENKDGLPLIRIRDLKTNAPQFYTPEVLPNTEYINAGDIVAGMDAEFIPYVWLGEKGVLNQRCCKFKGKNEAISNYYILFLIKPELEYVQSYKTGTTVSHLGKSDIDRFKIMTPPLDVVLAFSERVNPMKEEVVNRAKESRRLASLRDTLLPRLMSGELKVNEVI